MVLGLRVLGEQQACRVAGSRVEGFTSLGFPCVLGFRVGL